MRISSCEVENALSLQSSTAIEVQASCQVDQMHKSVILVLSAA